MKAIVSILDYLPEHQSSIRRILEKIGWVITSPALEIAFDLRYTRLVSPRVYLLPLKNENY